MLPAGVCLVRARGAPRRTRPAPRHPPGAARAAQPSLRCLWSFGDSRSGSRLFHEGTNGPLWNGRGCGTTSTWKAATRCVRTRPAGHSDPRNLARGSVICTSGMPSCRPVPGHLTSRNAEAWARPRTRSRRRRRRPRWPTCGRSRQRSARRSCAFTPPAPMTGRRNCTNCSPTPTRETSKNTGKGRPCTGGRPARIGPQQPECPVPSTPGRRTRGIVDGVGSQRRERTWQRPEAGTSWWLPPRLGGLRHCADC